eukprot:4970601-Prymnesium_polylepis.1
MLPAQPQLVHSPCLPQRRASPPRATARARTTRSRRATTEHARRRGGARSGMTARARARRDATSRDIVESWKRSPLHLPVRNEEESERQRCSGASAARRHARGSSGSATRRGGGARGEYDGALEEVAAPAATAAKKRPGADSDESARAGQHALHDDDARRTVQRLGDDMEA